MDFLSVTAVSAGAALGALLRWGLGVVLKPIVPPLPLGTLAANLAGGLLMGAAIHVFSVHTNAVPEARLAVMTGFLAGSPHFRRSQRRS